LALKEAANDLGRARPILQRIARAESPELDSSSDMKEGLVGLFSKENTFCMLKLHCRTDFVARTPVMSELASKLANLYFAKETSGEDLVRDAAAILKEPISIPEPVIIESTSLVGYYLHGSWAPNVGTIASVVQLECDRSTDELKEIARKLAQHVAGMAPRSTEELLEQPFLFADQSNGTMTVADYLRAGKTSNLNDVVVNRIWRLSIKS